MNSVIKKLSRNLLNDIFKSNLPCHQCYSNLGNLVTVNEENGVRRVEMINTKTRNALSLDMMDALLAGIRGNRDPALRCIVITSSGPVFSAGHNLKDLSNLSELFYKETFLKAAELMIAIREAPVPVIAGVNGIAAAAGCQLATSCDIVIATDESSFSTPGANFGIFCSTPGVALVRNIGLKNSAYMLFTGFRVKAKEAKDMGLLSVVCQESELEKEIEKTCEAIKAKSRSVVEMGKKFFYEQAEMDIKSAYRYGADVMTENLTLVDGQEGLKSFLEKRKPVWKNNFVKFSG